MKNAEPHVINSRNRHHLALSQLAQSLGGKESNGLKLWRQLRRVEGKAAALALRRCNDSSITQDEINKTKAFIGARVKAILGGLPPGFYINGDPRGWSLKLEPHSVPFDLHTDMGGDQILAPEIN